MNDFVMDLFRNQVAKSANSIALICGREQLTYGELDLLTNRLANRLKMMKIEQETLIGICVDRSLDMVIAILAIFKAGCAYVPLDPSYPQERLAFILEDARVEVVITQSKFLALFFDSEIKTLCLDCDSIYMEEQFTEQTTRTPLPGSLAYVIYTSGSTGTPKGVMISHSSLAQFIRIAGMALDVEGDDVYLQTASIAYALSVRQIMIPLASGAAIVIASFEEAHDPLLLFQLIKNKNVTLMDVVPSFWRSCIQRFSALPEEEINSLLNNSLRRIVSIGEPLGSEIPNEWRARFGQKVELVNIFGQTETTGVVATYKIPNTLPAHTGIVPIGSSISDTRLYILDSSLNQVSAGEQGELCISNPCLAVGYRNLSGLTAEKFVPNPFPDGLSERLYRTGDLARMREDGSIEFCGRRDHQVKIRGQRLELGEVEMVVREHSLVSECVVTVRGDQPDEKYLAAYIIPATHQDFDMAELREFVRGRLPEYMIPAAFVLLESFPVTPNGKLDRLALPDPLAISMSRNISLNSFVKPRDHIEQTIARIWKSLLKLERVSIHDNYFDLGGHSLMSVKMFARIERELGVRLPYNSLFQAATIAQLAELVSSRNEKVTKWPILVPIQISGERSPFFGVHGHDGGVLFWRDIVSYMPDDQPFYALQAQGVDGVLPPLNDIPDMAALYIKEIRKIQPHGPYYIGGYSLGGEIAFEMAQQFVRQGEKVNLLVLFDTRNPKRVIRLQTRSTDGTIVPHFQDPVSSGSYELLRQKIRGHYLRWSALNLREKIGYVLNQVTVRLRRQLIIILVSLFKRTNKHLPDILLLYYLREKHSEALINYVPSVYPGKVTLFRATETLLENPDDSSLGWAPLAGSGLDIYHIEGSHEIFRHQYAPDVAGHLNECLLKARDLHA